MGWLDALHEAIERRRAMRDIRKLEAQDRRDGFWAFKNQMVEALECFDRDQRRRAKDIWERACRTFPDEALKSSQCLSLMFKLELYQEIETLMKAGQKRYPADPRYLESLTRVSCERRDWNAALAQSARLRKKHPGSIHGYSLAARALSELGRSAEAEEVFASAFKILPNDPGLQIDHAKLAERREDWNTALDRWNMLYATCGHLAGISGAAMTLGRLGRFDEADALISSVVHKSGTDHLIWFASAKVAELKGDWELAASRWDVYRRRFPLTMFGYTAGLRALLKLGRHADVDSVIQLGIERLPDEPQLLIDYALAAHHRQDWDEAVRRWAEVRDRLPARREGYVHGAEALGHTGKAGEARELLSTQPA